MGAVSWVPFSLIIVFLVFGCLRLMYGAATKNRRIAELKEYADSYGQKLTEHHGRKLSCDEAIGPLKDKIRSLNARVASLATQVGDQVVAIVDLTEERDTAIAAVEAMRSEDSAAGWPS